MDVHDPRRGVPDAMGDVLDETGERDARRNGSGMPPKAQPVGDKQWSYFEEGAKVAGEPKR